MYLGVSISTKKLSAINCGKLVENMVIKIRVWSSRNIYSVLLSISVYWSQIFLLPKAVLKQVTSICRSFLWTDTCNSFKPWYVSWDDTCKPKSHGGLGFRAITHWNMAIVGKLVWDIALKADNLWMNWIHDRYIKDHEWNSYDAPQNANWVAKFITSDSFHLWE